jgi:integrase
VADDYDEADGDRVLNFGQAQQRAKGHTGRHAGGYTVADALADYLRLLEGEQRAKHNIRDTRYRAGLILPALGKIKVAALTSDRLRRWRDDLAAGPRRLRTGKGEAQKHRPAPMEGDEQRARRATANRVWTVLRAALNHAFHEGRADSDLAWRKVKPFKAVDAARVRYLSVPEARRLVNASGDEFRPLVQAALQTGCRYGELIRLTVADYNRDAGTLAIRQSKSGKPRHVVLTDEGTALFARLCAGRAGSETLLRKSNGQPWNRSSQGRPMADACERARISPPVSFHILRHTWASLAVMAGTPAMVVSRNLGHSTTKMVEHFYSHLAPTFVTDAIRKGAPRFGLEPDDNVVPLPR